MKRKEYQSFFLSISCFTLRRNTATSRENRQRLLKKNADREWFSFLSFRVLPMQMSLIKMSVAEEGVSLLLSWRLRTYVYRLARFISERRRKILLEKNESTICFYLFTNECCQRRLSLINMINE